jgi:DNA-binding GntR family transcriptional regulator
MTLATLAAPGRPGPPGKETRATRVCAALRGAIIAGDLAPGQRLKLNALRESHDISLSPLREAISRLAAERLVRVEDQRGFRVAPVSREDLVEVEDTRADLLALALGLAVERGDIDWESRVLSASHRLRRAMRGGDGPSPGCAHAGFLSALVSGCGRPMLLDICATLDNLHQRYVNLLGPEDAGGGAPPDPAQLAEAAVGRKKDLAVAYLRQQVEQAGEALLLRWDRAGPSPRAARG